MAYSLFNKKTTLYAPLSVSEKLGVGFWLCVGWLLIVFFCALLADYLPLPRPDFIDWDNPSTPMGTASESVSLRGSTETTASFVHLFGTDALGRDICSRLIFGARVSLAVGLLTPLIGLFLGGLLGLLAGYYRGRLESCIMSVMDAILAFPGLVLLLLVVFHFGSSLHNLIMALGFLTIPAFTRVARANTLTFSQREFVTAARAIGQNDMSIIMREIVPNILMPLLVYALLIVSYMIVAEGALSFLGLSVPAPTPSWGGMIAEGKEVLDESAHVSLIPALVMFLTVLCFNIIGDAARGLIDSRETLL